MSDTVTVQHPDHAGSTITVTAKAYAAVYANEGYVLAGGSKAPVTTALEQENARLREQLAGLDNAKAPDRFAGEAQQMPPRAPRKRAPRKAVVTPAPGPADISSTPTLDNDLTEETDHG